MVIVCEKSVTNVSIRSLIHFSQSPVEPVLSCELWQMHTHVVKMQNASPAPANFWVPLRSAPLSPSGHWQPLICFPCLQFHLFQKITKFIQKLAFWLFFFHLAQCIWDEPCWGVAVIPSFLLRSPLDRCTTVCSPVKGRLGCFQFGATWVKLKNGYILGFLWT